MFLMWCEMDFAHPQYFVDPPGSCLIKASRMGNPEHGWFPFGVPIKTKPKMAWLPLIPLRKVFSFFWVQWKIQLDSTKKLKSKDPLPNSSQDGALKNTSPRQNGQKAQKNNKQRRDSPLLRCSTISRSNHGNGTNQPATLVTTT